MDYRGAGDEANTPLAKHLWYVPYWGPSKAPRFRPPRQTLVLLARRRWFALPLPRGFCSSPKGRRGFRPAQGVSWGTLPPNPGQRLEEGAPQPQLWGSLNGYSWWLRARGGIYGMLLLRRPLVGGFRGTLGGIWESVSRSTPRRQDLGGG